MPTKIKTKSQPAAEGVNEWNVTAECPHSTASPRPSLNITVGGSDFEPFKLAQ